MSYGFFGPVLENHMVLPEREYGPYEYFKPEPVRCVQCDFEAETEIEGEPLCWECIANDLCPGWV